MIAVHIVFSSPEPKDRVSYCHSAPSVRCKCFTFSTSSEPLDGFWWNLVGMKFSWSLTSVFVFLPDPSRGRSRAGAKKGSWQVLLFLGQICPGGGSRTGPKKVTRVPFFNKLLLQTGRLQQQTECIAIIKKHLGRSVVIVGSISKSNFWRVVYLVSKLWPATRH